MVAPAALSLGWGEAFKVSLPPDLAANMASTTLFFDTSQGRQRLFFPTPKLYVELLGVWSSLTTSGALHSGLALDFGYPSLFR